MSEGHDHGEGGQLSINPQQQALTCSVLWRLLVTAGGGVSFRVIEFFKTKNEAR